MTYAPQRPAASLSRLLAVLTTPLANILSLRYHRYWLATDIERHPVSEYDLEPCVYCGMPADTKDHVIPRSYSAMLYDVNTDRRKLLKAFGETVPACHECNCSLLQAVAIFTVVQRKRYVKEKLRKKYKRVLNAPDWTENEIDMTKGLLRQHLQQKQRHKELIQERIRW